MEITKQESFDKFTVAVGVDLSLGEKRIETLTLQLGDTHVKLNKEECQELINVLDGKCHKFAAFRNEQEYQAHSVLLVSAHGKEHREATLYTEDSIAKF